MVNVWNKVDVTNKIDQSIKRKMKFLVDSNLGCGVKDYLVANGWGATYANDVGLQGKSDEDVYQYAKKNKRILLTHDADFKDDRQFPYFSDTAVVILPGGSGSEQVLLRALGILLSYIAPFRDAFF